jgi:hypothetical protein
MKKVKFDWRCGVERREFHYSVYIPEKRNGNDRRIDNNAKRVSWVKITNKIKNYIMIWLKESRF